MICPSDGLDFRPTRIALSLSALLTGRSYRAGAALLYLFESYALDTDRRELGRGPVLLPVEPQAFDPLVLLVKNRSIARDQSVE